MRVWVSNDVLNWAYWGIIDLTCDQVVSLVWWKLLDPVSGNIGNNVDSQIVSALNFVSTERKEL